jgi:hypothetical protein
MNEEQDTEWEWYAIEKPCKYCHIFLGMCGYCGGTGTVLVARLRQLRQQQHANNDIEGSRGRGESRED